MITGIHHACFTVRDLKRSISFYRGILGMEVLWDWLNEGIKYKGERSDKVTGCPGPNSTLSIQASREASLNWSNTRHQENHWKITRPVM